MCGYGCVKSLKPQRETDHTTDVKPMNEFSCGLSKHKMSEFMMEIIYSRLLLNLTKVIPFHL